MFKNLTTEGRRATHQLLAINLLRRRLRDHAMATYRDELAFCMKQLDLTREQLENLVYAHGPTFPPVKF